jgi:hypothetical protein
MKMKTILVLLVGTFSLIQPSAQAVVYGSDNRTDLFQVTNPIYQKAASSVAALMASAKLNPPAATLDANGDIHPYSLVYGQVDQLCTDERFYHQPDLANCSGFLIAPNLIATAGHCMETQDYCTKYDWVFDYTVSSDGQTSVTIPQANVYHCAKIVAHVQDDATETDLAIVQLDRAVTGHTPIALDPTSNLTFGDKVVLAGFPSGLPMKLSEGQVTDFDDHLYWTNVDDMVINSGSLIFNANTGNAEGIFVMGTHDFTLDPILQNCFRMFTLAASGGLERVVKISALIPYFNAAN